MRLASPHRQCRRRSDQSFYENYSCGSERNYTNYCNREIEKLFDQQSAETDKEKRKKLVWEIDKKLQEDVARPIIFHGRQGSCWQPTSRHHHHGEQLIQRLSLRRRLDGQVTSTIAFSSEVDPVRVKKARQNKSWSRF